MLEKTMNNQSFLSLHEGLFCNSPRGCFRLPAEIYIAKKNNFKTLACFLKRIYMFQSTRFNLFDIPPKVCMTSLHVQSIFIRLRIVLSRVTEGLKKLLSISSFTFILLVHGNLYYALGPFFRQCRKRQGMRN